MRNPNRETVSPKTMRISYSKIYWILSLFFIFFHCRVIALEKQKIFTAKTVQQGRILQSFIYPIGLHQKVEFTLLDSKQKIVIKNTGFLFNYREKKLLPNTKKVTQDSIHMGLIGIHSQQKVGQYTLRARITSKYDHEKILDSPIRILDRVFAQETIILNQKMNRTLSSKDPIINNKKRKQAIKMWSILNSSNHDSLFYFKQLSIPISPTEGRSSSAFGNERTFVYPSGKIGNTAHQGFDIAAVKGTKVFASSPGRVVMAEDRIVTGKTVILEFLPGIYIKYQHLDQIAVHLGDVLQEHAVIGEVGKTGFATGNHLHTELWVSSTRVDPSYYFKFPIIDTNAIISMIN